MLDKDLKAAFSNWIDVILVDVYLDLQYFNYHIVEDRLLSYHQGYHPIWQKYRRFRN